MNCALIGFEYSNERFLLAAGEDVSIVMGALMRAELVRVDGYGDSAKVTPTTSKLEIQILADNDPRLLRKEQAKQQPELAAALEALEKATNDATLGTYKAEQRADELQKKLDQVMTQVAAAHLGIQPQPNKEPAESQGSPQMDPDQGAV